ncbi:putative sugar phosphate isomerase YwlF [Candidatus Terasakiella magnetica]|uniref:Putative sugar phosphate isomerase YwlF n=1 Tax=Candidatus Terasakiella magnetica TaxID=1867952 RepID=A0A1C3RCW2_9PROT|nr:ribose 5-phosphate isomerase B [Candidatus Terasakiella magnetica]SCA55119.1 putative sugar phosphate isomerase YwlF [Candidatus Terasakiella magnetica]
MASQKIAIACDHGGFGLKSTLIEDLKTKGFEVLDLGCEGSDSVDYPDYAYKLAQAIKDGQADRGVVVCGSGIGISIAVNRFSEVRCALIHDALGARMCREHNDANVIAFGDRMIGEATALDCLDVFLTTEFEGGRHARRVEKLSNPPL